jgi:hypothetical protein
MNTTLSQPISNQQDIQNNQVNNEHNLSDKNQNNIQTRISNIFERFIPGSQSTESENDEPAAIERFEAEFTPEEIKQLDSYRMPGANQEIEKARELINNSDILNDLDIEITDANIPPETIFVIDPSPPHDFL